jgi:hypothetical protein
MSRPTPPGDLLAAARALSCPDCLADTELEPGPRGVWLLTIRHDPTCPRFRTVTRHRRPDR